MFTVSLNARKQFRPFGQHSDVDIAVISSHHFDAAWAWFRRTDPVILGLDVEGRKMFDKHRSHYIFEGVVAANYFLSYLPFKQDWNFELQRAENLLPSTLQGRPTRVRIYRDSESLRLAQAVGLQSFRSYLGTRKGGNSQ